MQPTKVLQEIRKMRFEEAYEGWNAGRLTQAEAARIRPARSQGTRQKIHPRKNRRGIVDSAGTTGNLR